MKLLHRRILFSSLFLLFAVTAPLTVFYASGYRYNTRLGRIEQAGLLYLTTEQKDIKMTLDGQPAGEVKQRLLLNLRPRYYDVLLEKEGYHSWKKRLNIQEGQTTFIRDLVLFQDAQPEPFELFVNPLSLLKETEQLAVYHTQDHLVVYKKEDGSIAEIPFEKAEEISLIALHEEELPAAMKAGSSWFRLDEDEKITNIDEQLPQKTTSVLFRDGKLFALTSDKLWAVSDKNEPAPVLSLPLLRDVWMDGAVFWLLAADQGKQRVFLYKAEEATARPRFLLALPYSEDISIADIAGNFLTISDRANEQLHLADAAADLPIVTTLPGVHAFAWSQSHEELLTATDFEVTIQHFKNKREQELLARISSPIGDVAWHEGEQHVFYATNGTVYIAARDNRDERYVAKLAEGYENLHIIDSNLEELRFTSQQANSFIFWRLPL